MPSPREGCIFCDIVRNGNYVAKAKGFVAIHDINPKADTHLLVIPERHVDTFREVGEFHASETKHMLEFIADVAAKTGLTDYRVVTNVGPGAGQTVFHLHWHVLGNAHQHDPDFTSLTAITEL